MKTLAQLYKRLAYAYLVIFIVLAAIALGQGRYMDISICVIGGFVGLSFGLLTSELLKRYELELLND